MINNPALPFASNPGSGQGFFSSLIPALLAALLVIGGVVFIFMLLWGGLEWMTAGGDKGKIESARQRVSNAIIGVVILFSFFAILNVIECFFGIGLRGITIAAFNIQFNGAPLCQ